MVRTARLPMILCLLGVLAGAQEPTSRPANHLVGATSPYLRQHAGNPVDWWPWCPEAFAEAERRGLPIFLSIGYSTCHWCHVMERESFANAEVAAALNATFVCIKLDREERPDIDAVYMRAVQALQGNGGWPATILILPDRRPFWAATYLEPRSLLALCEQVGKHWRDDRAGIETNAGKLLDHLIGLEARARAAKLPTLDLRARAVRELARAFDQENGGFGGAPKFPRVPSLLFLLRSRDEEAPNMVWTTLAAMAHGGIHDHVGGGLHRYAVDAAWKLPHFEKMLYDQAQGLDLCLELGQSCAEDRAFAMAEDLVTCLLRDFRTPDGAFRAAIDADTEGVEGATYVWTRAEVEKLLAGDELKVVLDRFELEPEGNQDQLQGLGKAKVLRVVHRFAASAERLGMDQAALVRHWRSARAKLFAARERRPQPRADDKVIAAWNGLAIGALARAGRALDRPDWIAAARTAADFVDRELRDDEGRPCRRYVAGEAAHPATLEDHAELALGLLDLFLVAKDPKDLARARAAAARIVDHHDAKLGGFLDSLQRDDLVLPTREAIDGALPSSNGAAALALLRLQALDGDESRLELVDSVLQTFAADLQAAPSAHPLLLRVLAMRLEGPRTLVLVGDPTRADTKAMAAILRARFLGDALLIMVSPEEASTLAELLPLLAGKTAAAEGAPRVYVCRGSTCLEPATDPESLRRRLEELDASATKATEDRER
ncbi:MAG: thioredoxin domain-containing protein [Planctomycetes bacterium]|nr:thioredoxin domain-containing protein [Planctomycetota bacterium]